MELDVKKVPLFEDETEEIKLQINKNYAKNYNIWREKEELQKLKSKYGDEIEASSSSDEEEEDEDAVELTAAVDRKWFAVMAALRRNDPKIYQKDVQFFDKKADKKEESSDDSDSSASVKGKKDDNEKVTIKDQFRKFITENNGTVSDSDEEEEEEKKHEPGYYEEQASIKQSLTKAISAMSSDEDDEDILKRRVKNKQEEEEEEEEYVKFLKGEMEKEALNKDKSMAEDLAFLREYHARPDVTEDEKELWRIIVEQSSRKKKKNKDEDWYAEQMRELYAEEDLFEEQEEFEQKYNFRFEEEDSDFIKTYSRNPTDALRQKDNKRSLKRQETKERKQKEMALKREEIRVLKNMKKREMSSKLELLMKEHPEVEYSAKDLKGDFDPEAHDKMMKEKFEQYDGDDTDDDEEKPVFDDDSDVENWDEYDETVGGTSNATEEPSEVIEADEEQFESSKFNMDADNNLSEPTGKSGRKRKKKFKEIVGKRKPKIDDVFDKYKSSKTPLDDYIKDYYNLGYKEYGFKYHETVPNDYGLDCGEILWLPTRELNAWASIKSVTEHKPEADDLYEKKKYQSAKMQRKKFNVLPSLRKMTEESYMEDIRPQTLREQKEQLQSGYSDDEDSDEEAGPEQSPPELSPKKKQKSKPAETVSVQAETVTQKKKKKKTSKLGDQSEMASGFFAEDSSQNKKKKKKNSEHKLKAVSTGDSSLQADKPEETLPNGEQSFAGNASQQSPKKKKRKAECLLGADSPGVEGSPKKKKKKLQQSGGSEVSELHKHSEQKVEDKKGEKVAEGERGQADIQTQKKKKKKQKAQAGEDQPALSSPDKKQGKKKKKGKGKPKKQGYQAVNAIPESRLAAYNIDPKKYKYTKHRIVPSQPQTSATTD